MIEILDTKEEALKYALHHYRNHQMFSNDEFYEDCKTFFYIKKLLTRYKKGESQNHHLTLNHIITLSNLFGPVPARTLLRYHIPKECHGYLNAFLSFLNILPKSETSTGETIIPRSEENVNVDQDILDYLRKI